jgi:hypothetical protein
MSAGAMSAATTQHSLHDLLQVGLALPQVVVLHLVELAGEHFQVSGQRPFGVVVPVDDPVAGTAREGLVVQQHEVHVQQSGQFVRRVFGEFVLQRRQLQGDGIARAQQTVHLALDLVRRDEVVRHVDAAGCDQHGTADGHASRDRNAEDLKTHDALRRSRGQCSA